MNLKTTGLKELERKLDKINKNIDSINNEEIKKGSELILNESKKLAPKDTGQMIRETDIKKISNKETHIRFNSDHSLYVHEDLEARHINGQAKFLSIATENKGKEAIELVAKEFFNNLKGII